MNRERCGSFAFKIGFLFSSPVLSQSNELLYSYNFYFIPMIIKLNSTLKCLFINIFQATFYRRDIICSN